MPLKPLLIGAAWVLLPLAPAAPERPGVPASFARRAQQRTQGETYATQVTQGAVTLEVTPRWEDGKLVVEVRANTHTVELSRLDLGAQTHLFVGDREIAPASAGKLLGHHGRATLVFRLERRPERFVIVIRDVPDMPLRRMAWPAGETPS